MDTRLLQAEKSAGSEVKLSSSNSCSWAKSIVEIQHFQLKNQHSTISKVTSPSGRKRHQQVWRHSLRLMGSGHGCQLNRPLLTMPETESFPQSASPLSSSWLPPEMCSRVWSLSSLSSLSSSVWSLACTGGICSSEFPNPSVSLYWSVSQSTMSFISLMHIFIPIMSVEMIRWNSHTERWESVSSVDALLLSDVVHSCSEEPSRSSINSPSSSLWLCWLQSSLQCSFLELCATHLAHKRDSVTLTATSVKRLKPKTKFEQF